MNKKTALYFLLFSFVLTSCQGNNLSLDKEVTRIEVYSWESKDRIKVFDDASFIKNLMAELNDSTVEKLSDASDITVPPYKAIFKNKENTVIEMGFHQTENGAYYLDSDNQVRYIISMPLPDVPVETNSMTKEEIEELNKRERELEEKFRNN